jgi:hypothetical protein
MAVEDRLTEGSLHAGSERRWVMITGVLFGVLFTAGMLLSGNTPDYDAEDSEWTDWFDDGGNRALQIISMFLLVLAAVSFVVFLTYLVRRLRLARAAAETPAQIAFGAGLLVALSIAIGGVAVNQMSAAIEIGDIPIPNADVLRTAEQFGFGLILVVGGLFAALTVAAVSFAARGGDVLPKWLVTAGFVAAVILIFSVAFIPLIVLPLWAILVAVTARA